MCYTDFPVVFSEDDKFIPLVWTLPKKKKHTNFLISRFFCLFAMEKLKKLLDEIGLKANAPNNILQKFTVLDSSVL